MQRTVESVAQFGVLAPLIARPRPEGRLRDHIRAPAAATRQSWPGLTTLPVIVWNMSDDEAVIHMVDSKFAARTHPAQRTGVCLQNEAGSHKKARCQVGFDFGPKLGPKLTAAEKVALD